jgi:hypothetical protein
VLVVAVSVVSVIVDWVVELLVSDPEVADVELDAVNVVQKWQVSSHKLAYGWGQPGQKISAHASVWHSEPSHVVLHRFPGSRSMDTQLEPVVMLVELEAVVVPEWVVAVEVEENVEVVEPVKLEVSVVVLSVPEVSEVLLSVSVDVEFTMQIPQVKSQMCALVQVSQ